MTNARNENVIASHDLAMSGGFNFLANNQFPAWTHMSRGMAWIILDRHISTPAVLEKSNDFHWGLGHCTTNILNAGCLGLNIWRFGLLGRALPLEPGLTILFGI